MATGGCRERDIDFSDSDLEIDVISPEEMTRICDNGNEQTWLCCPADANPNSYVDLTEFLQIQSSTDDRERLYRAVSELEASKGGGIDTRTFTRPKKMSLYHPLPKVSEPALNTSFQPSGEVNNRYSFLSKTPTTKPTSSLKDVTNSTFNSTFDTTLKKSHVLQRIINFDEINIAEQTMIADMTTPQFLSISDSEDGISENIPNVSLNSKYNESRIRRGKSVENRTLTLHYKSTFMPASVSTPSIQPKCDFSGSSLDNSDNLNSSSDATNKSTSIDGEVELLGRTIHSTPTTKLQHSPKLNGTRRLSYNTMRLSKTEELKHFKSVESGLDSTFEVSQRSPGRMSKDLRQVLDSTYSSTGNLPRSLGDVHLAAQQQEYELRDDADQIRSVPVSSLKSPMKKVLSENCIFTSSDTGKLRIAPSHHGSVCNLTSNNNKDNNNQAAEYPSKLRSAGSKKTLASGLPVSIRPSTSKPKSKIPSRLPTRMPRLQPSHSKVGQPDWTEGCF